VIKFFRYFDNQAFNTPFNWAVRSAYELIGYLDRYEGKRFDIHGKNKICVHPASAISEFAELYVTDPPYADAINYHEITEFFIAWLRKNPPQPFDQWTWDSRRDLAIKGKGECSGVTWCPRIPQ